MCTYMHTIKISTFVFVSNYIKFIPIVIIVVLRGVRINKFDPKLFISNHYCYCSNKHNQTNNTNDLLIIEKK